MVITIKDFFLNHQKKLLGFLILSVKFEHLFWDELFSQKKSWTTHKRDFKICNSISRDIRYSKQKAHNYINNFSLAISLEEKESFFSRTLFYYYTILVSTKNLVASFQAHIQKYGTATRRRAYFLYKEVIYLLKAPSVALSYFYIRGWLSSLFIICLISFLRHETIFASCVFSFKKSIKIVNHFNLVK